MKKYILAIACLFSALTSFAQDALTIENAAIKAGETGQLKVIVTNPENKYIACQFDFTLPTGLDVQRTSSGKASSKNTCILTNRTQDDEEEVEFKFTFTEIGTNQFRVVMYNDGNLPFFGASGDPILLLNVTAAEGFTGGNGTVNAIELTTEDRKTYKAPEAEFTVAETTGISNVEKAEKMGGTIYNLAGQKVSKAQKGIYIQNGKKVVKK